MLQIRDAMTRHVFSVTPETTLREAADLFAHHHISGAPVLAGHRVVGVVSASDLLEFVATHDGRRSGGDSRSASEGEERTLEELDSEPMSVYFRNHAPGDDSEQEEPFLMDDTLPDDLFNEHTVEDVMTRAICALPPEAGVVEAAKYMWQAGIHRLLVLENGNLAGILSMSDIGRILAADG